MKNVSKKSIIGIFILTVLLLLIIVPIVFYTQILPKTISHPKFIEFVQKTTKEAIDANLTLKNPILKTDLSPIISFKTDEIALSKNKKTLFSLKNLDTTISLAKIPEQKIILKRFFSDNVFIDVNGLLKLVPAEKQEPQEFNWNIEWLDSSFFVKKCLIIYKPTNEALIRVNGKNFEITKERKPKRVHFDITVDIRKGNDKIKLAFSDKNNIFIQNRKLHINNFILKINNSNITINSVADNNSHFSIMLTSKCFDVKNIVKLLNTNLVVPNGTEILSLFKNIDGSVDFKIKLTNKNLRGEIILNKGFFKIVQLADLPVTITSGKAILTENDVFLKNIQGYYGKNKDLNTIKVKGSVKDYTKTVKSDIEIETFATNELAKIYLSKMINSPIELTGKSRAKIKVNSIYDKVDVTWFFKIKKGNDLLIDGNSFTPKDYDRALRGDVHFEDNILTIKSIDYLIAEIINRKTKPDPILNIFGKIDFSKDIAIKNLGLEIPKPLPSEFLNLFIGQKFFKKGTIQGNLEIINTGKIPMLNGTMAFEQVRIPSQRLSIKEGKLTTDNNLIHINAFGRFKKSDYKFTGNINNTLIFPIIVKNINLTVDNIDIERVLKSFNNQSSTPVEVKKIDNDVTDETYSFNPNILIIENCVLNVIKGVYKQIKFGNLNATLTLNKNGILQVQSNKFDFAEGISSCKVYCDLKKHQYSIRLGAKDVNSDILATSLLALNKEISGKASALMEFYSDDSLKLNGKIQFIVKNGTITKLGLVEYILNFAALFRNPVVMISPSTLVDLVNIPDGTFNSIIGILDIKNNIVEKIDLKSSSPQLSSFVIGKMNLENGDSSLRIYTKFSNKNKGFAGFLRNLSLNSLANKVPLNNNNEINYYSAEISQLPPIEANEKDSQIFLTKVDGDIQTNNFLSSLKKIK